MHQTKLRYVCLAILACSTLCHADRNPATIQLAQKIINQRAEALGVQPPIRLRQQLEGGAVIWFDNATRSGIVAALQNDADFEANNMVFFPSNSANFGSYSQEALGGGYQNTLQYAPLAGFLQLDPPFAGSQALLYVTNEAGQAGPDQCEAGVTSGPLSCLGGWHIPNLLEFKTMFKALCDSAYELPSNKTYWTSSYPLDNSLTMYAVNIPEDNQCDVSQLTVTATDPTTTGYSIRYLRQFR